MRLRTYALAFLLLVGLSACASTGGPLPTEEGYLSIGGAQIFYKTVGRGEPLLFIHGGPVLDHTYFFPQIEDLARDFRLIFYDQRLCGRSSVDVDTSTISFDGFVADIEGVREAFGLDQMNLVGHSWGGLLAQVYAVRHPDRLKHLILLDSIAPTAALWQQEQTLMDTMTTEADSLDRVRIMDSAAYREQRPEAFEQLMRLSFRHQFADIALLDSLTLVLPDDFVDRSVRFGHLLPDLMGFDLRERLGKVDCPALVLYGEHEVSAELAGPALRDALPDARLVILEGSGHFPFIEQPAAFRAAIVRFLNP